MIRSYKGIAPQIASTAFIEASAQIIGDTHIGEDSSVWFNCVLRADVHSIRVGHSTNIQDGTVIHVTNGRFSTEIGNRVTIGHGVMLHGCSIKDRALIGIGSIILDNVVMTGNMSCNLQSQGNKIWLVNGTSTTLNPNCLSLLIPVEKIDKQNPVGQTTASVGVPFTYRMTIPVLFDPYTGTVINFAGSVNDLHGITITDDLNATGADLTYISHTVTWKNSGAPRRLSATAARSAS